MTLLAAIWIAMLVATVVGMTLADVVWWWRHRHHWWARSTPTQLTPPSGSSILPKSAR